MKRKWFRHLIIFLCIFALCGVFLWGAWQLWFDPYRGTVNSFHQSERLETVLSGPQAVEDFDYIVARLKERHPACINGLPEKVQIEYERERMRITSLPGVSVLELWQSAARLLVSMGDAHTSVGVKYEDARKIPFSFKWEDGLVCVGGEYDGYAVIQIGGVVVNDLYERFLTQFPYELETWAHYSFASRLNRSEYLSFIGLDTRNDIPFVFEHLSDGSRITVEIALRESFTSDAEEETPHFDYSVDKSADIGIFSLRKCVYDQEYKDGLRMFFTEVQKNDIHNVIVDLRGNLGGSSLVANEFIGYLPVQRYNNFNTEMRQGPIIFKNKSRETKNQHFEPVFSGNVYVLTGIDTFSAAMDFAVLISDNGLGTVIGESPGNMPSCYGEVLCFQTPNARLAFTVSCKYFVRPDRSKSDLPLIPDVIVPAKSALEEPVKLIGSEGR